MLYALLLAGGKSSRMGQDKRLLEIAGRTLVDHALDLLTAAGADRILISGDVPGHDGIPDRIPGCGPPGGLHAAVHHIAATAGLDGSPLLVIPVDMPLLDAGTLARLVEAIGEAGTCHFAGEIFPCVFRLTPQLRDHLDTLFATFAAFAAGGTKGGERSMQALLRAFPEQVVDTAGLDAGMFMNLNNPDDWQAFCRGQGTNS